MIDNPNELLSAIQKIAFEANAYMGCGDALCLFNCGQDMGTHSGCKCGGQKTPRGMAAIARLLKLCLSIEVAEKEETEIIAAPRISRGIPVAPVLVESHEPIDELAELIK